MWLDADRLLRPSAKASGRCFQGKGMWEKLQTGLAVAMGRNHRCQNNVWQECHSGNRQQKQQVNRELTGGRKEGTSLSFLQPCSLALLPPVGGTQPGSRQRSRNKI